MKWSGAPKDTVAFDLHCLEEKEKPKCYTALFLAALRRCDSRKIVLVCACQDANLNAIYIAETDLRLWLHPELSLGNTIVFKSCFAEAEKKTSLCYRYSLISLNCTVICSVAYTKALATTWSCLLVGKDKPWFISVYVLAVVRFTSEHPNQVCKTSS